MEVMVPEMDPVSVCAKKNEKHKIEIKKDKRFSMMYKYKFLLLSFYQEGKVSIG